MIINKFFTFFADAKSICVRKNVIHIYIFTTMAGFEFFILLEIVLIHRMLMVAKMFSFVIF